MKIEDIVTDLQMSVDFYAKAIYDWEKHNSAEAQTVSDVNKERGFIKIFQDGNKNLGYILRSKNPVVIDPTIMINFTPRTQELMREIIKKDFYFIGLLKANESFENLIFPDEIYLSLKDAEDNIGKFFLNEI